MFKQFIKNKHEPSRSETGTLAGTYSGARAEIKRERLCGRTGQWTERHASTYICILARNSIETSNKLQSAAFDRSYSTPG